MKPNFALSLSFEGIRLLHRSGTGWTKVGEVALDSPDLAGELAVLRKTALALDPAGLRTKIILPNDQIRYLALDTTRATADEVRATLEGATPYRVDDLAWDFVKGGGRTYIAAVARETLDEAESFAAEHRFGPVSFVAIPDEFAFVGEPFFGPTKVAASLIAPGETVERDPVPVKLTAPPRPPRTNAPTKTAVAEPPMPDDKPESPPALTEAKAPEAPPPAPPDPPAPAEMPESLTPTAPMANTSVAGTVLPEASVPPPLPPEPTPAPSAPPASVAEVAPAAAEAETAPAPIVPPPPPAQVAPPAPAAPASDPVEPDEPAPVFSSRARPQRALVADPDQRPAGPPAAAAAPAKPAPEKSAADKAEPMFSRRTPPPVTAPKAPPAAPVAAAPAVPPPPKEVTAPPLSAAPAGVAPAAPVPASGRISIDSVATPPPRPAEPVAPRITGVSLGQADRQTVVPFAPPRPAAAAPAAPAPDAGARIAPFPPRVKPPGVETPTRRADPLAATPAPRGKPRFLLPILMAILILVMLIAALWLGRTDNVVSRFFGAGSDATDVAAAVPVAVPLVIPEDPVAEVAALPQDPAPDPAPTEVALPETALPEDVAAVAPPEEVAASEATEVLATAEPPDEVTGELVPAEEVAVSATESALPDAVAAAAAAAFVADAIADLAAREVASETAVVVPDPALDESPAVPAPGGEITVVSPEEADAFYAATGVWLRAPRLPVEPETEDLAALSLSGMDPELSARDGVALPATAPDVGLVPQINPPPPGTRLPRDDRGFILATPEGTITPNGLVIYAGSPTLLPPTRPGTVAPEIAPAALAEQPDTAIAEVAPPVDQPLAAPPTVRPQARTATFLASLPPEALGTAETPTDPITETAAALPGGVALTDLSPPARPASVAALAPEPLPEYAGLRPAPRPEGLAPEGATSAAPAEPAIDPEAALAQTLASIVEGAGDPLATATAQAVAVARRPDARPNNFARVVEQQTARLARATQTAAEQTAPASLGTPEESAETEAEEVEVAAAAPSGNVPRSVSEAATMENAMSLREINLIGVYGTPNDRRALVRLENGRYVRVSVGDSLDGGQVSAISDSALNYVRRGRTITLEIAGN